MTDEAICELTGVEILKAVRSCALVANDVARAFFTRAKRLNPVFGAWCHLDEGFVESRLSQLSDKGKQDELYGLPFGVKDIFNVKGCLAEYGSPLRRGYRPNNDCRVVSSLINRDAICIGKTATAEFGVHFLEDGRVKNAIDPSRIPGTSSTGSAVAVATRTAPIAIGSQTAGSICRPASYNKVIGFKPSFGTVSRTGVLKTADTLDTIGVFANCIEDVSLWFNSVRVSGPNYPFVDAKLARNKSEASKPRKNIRVGVLSTGLTLFDNFDGFLFSQLEKIASTSNLFSFEELVAPSYWNPIHRDHELIYAASLAYYFKQEWQAEKESLSGSLVDMIDLGNTVSLPLYKKLLSDQWNKSSVTNQELQFCDVIMTVTTASSAPFIGGIEADDTALIWTYLGMPCISLPLLCCENGLPCGLMLVAKKYDDDLLLRVALELMAYFQR